MCHSILLFQPLSIYDEDRFITPLFKILLVSRALLLTVLLAGLIVVGTSTPAWAAQLDARINPNDVSSPFSMKEKPSPRQLKESLEMTSSCHFDLLTHSCSLWLNTFQ